MADKNQALAKALRTSSSEPQYIRGNLLPFKKDIKTKEVSFGMPTVAQGLIDALTAPYRAMKGEIDVDSPQGVQEALNFGLNFMGGGSIPAIGKTIPKGQLGITAYHASPIKFDKFDPAKIGSNTDEGFLGHGAYFSTDPNVAANNPNLQTMKFDVNYENPLKLDFNNWSDNKKEIILNQLNLPKNSSSKDITNKLKELGHDSVELNYLPVGYNQKEIMLINSENAKKIK